MDNRATLFRDWLFETARLTDQHLARLSVESAQALLAAYLFQVKQKKQVKSGRPFAPKTLVNHLNAAHLCLEQLTRLTIPIRERRGEKDKLMPMFGDTIAMSQKWRQPYPKREAFTWEIFVALHRMVLEVTKDDITCYLDLIATVFDWLRLGCFTGSRAGEYAQTHTKRGEYSEVPHDDAAGPWAGYAIAFIKEDFLLLSRSRHVLPNTWKTLQRGKRVHEVQVRFRFDKSKDNFIIRKFRRGTGFMCPVNAVLSILRRALILKVSDKEPLGVHRWGTQGHYTYLRSSDLIDVVRDACRKAYPDPKHFLRINITRLVAHSNRVTAAVALYVQGWTIERIADRLRWTPASVKHYLRESSHAIGDMTTSAIKGAMVL